MRLCLDTSALVKRYVKEEGSDAVRRYFVAAYGGEATLVLSAFNIGEALSALHKAVRRAGAPELYPRLKSRLLGDVKRLTRIGSMKVIPLTISAVLASAPYVERHGLYIADALQIATAKATASTLATGDARLCDAARAEGLDCVLV
jgi:predicted nucleic acid-binding protein